MAIAVNIIILLILIGLLMTYAVQLISIVKLFNFVTRSKWVRGFLYFMLVPFSVLYINENFHMMMYYWGSGYAASQIQSYYYFNCNYTSST